MDPNNPNNPYNPSTPGQPMQQPPASTSWAANSFTPAPAPMPFPPAPPAPGMTPMPQQPVSTASIAPPPMEAVPPMPAPNFAPPPPPPAPMAAPTVFAPAPAPAPVDIMANPPTMQSMPPSSPLTAYQSSPAPAPVAPEQSAFQPTMPPPPMAPPPAAPSMYSAPEPAPAWNMAPPPPPPPASPGPQTSLETPLSNPPQDMSQPTFPSSVGSPIFNQNPSMPNASETPSPFGFVSPSVQTAPPAPMESAPASDPMAVINEAAKTETSPDWVSLSSGGQTNSLSTPTNLSTETAGMNATLPPEFSGMSGGSPADQVYSPPISSPDSLLVPQSGIPPQAETHSPARRIPWKLAIAGVVVIVAIAGGAFYYFFGQSAPAPEAASIPASKTQLPLTNPPKTVSAATAGATKATAEPTSTPVPEVQGVATSAAKAIASPSAKPKTATSSGSSSSVLERLKNRPQ